MKKNNIHKLRIGLLTFMGILFFLSCNGNQESENDPRIWTTGEENTVPENEGEVENQQEETETENDPSFSLPDIDLNHWKVTLPVGNNGRPTEVEPPEILDYATNETLRPFMYNDSIEGALVFYTYPGVTTANSSRSRTELREQISPGSNNTNWTFAQGGRMYGTLQMDDISKDHQGKYHRTIIMQIHGRLTNEQRDLIGEDDNNAPPVLKIYWQDGKVRVKSKVLKNTNTTGTNLLYTNAWTDDDGFNFDQEVGFDKFSLEVKVEEGRMEVILNDGQSVVYDNESMDKWSVFENYFKAGNYLQTTDSDAFAKIKFYDLTIEH